MAQVPFSFATTPNSDIPDGNPLGITHTQEIHPGFNQIAEIRLSLSISGRGAGGFNGDLFAYVAHNGQLAVLLNRPGRAADNPFGYPGDGLAVTFDDDEAYDIHLYGNHLPAGQPLTQELVGTWRPDGRLTDPALALDTDPSGPGLDAFRGMNPDGYWTLFIADLEPGGTSRLVSWELEVIPIPEPSFTVGTVCLALLALAGTRVVVAFK
jgi:subtilisin-like proprotein convertase family protein